MGAVDGNDSRVERQRVGPDAGTNVHVQSRRPRRKKATDTLLVLAIDGFAMQPDEAFHPVGRSCVIVDTREAVLSVRIGHFASS